MNKEILAYSVDFVSYLIDSLEEPGLKNIVEIILFGSAARGTSDRESDVDIFVNVLKQNNMEAKVERIKEGFYRSDVFKRWKLRGIENEIRPIVDRLAKWRDLKVSIISDGITLYSKYTARAKGEQQVIIYWEKIKPESKRVLLSKKLYGYTYKKSRYKGLLELTGSVKIGPNCIIVSLEHSRKITDLFRSLGITAKTIFVSRI